MIRKRNILLLSFCLSSYLSFAQIKLSPVLDTSRLRQVDYGLREGRLYLKAGLLNSFNPTAPSMDIGLEWLLSRRLSLEILYGFRTERINYEKFKDHLYFDNYYKVWGAIRYTRLGRTQNKLGGKRMWPAFYALETYYSKGNTVEERNYVIGEFDRRIDYREANINKWVYAANLKAGYLFSLGKKIEFEAAFGLSNLFYERKYLVFGASRSRGFGPDNGIRVYDDRQIGFTYIPLIPFINLKLNYQIF